MTLASLALVCGVVAQKANTNAPLDGVSAPMMQRAGVAAAPSPSQGGGCDGEGATATSGCDGEGATATSGCDGEGATATPANMQRPANAQDVEEWELRGAYDDAIRIPAVGWDFRTPDGFIEGMTVFSRGEFRPDVGHLYFPRPFTNDLSFLPRAKWHLLRGVAATPSSSQGGGSDGEGAAATPESKLWYAATPSNSLLVTWVNGLLDRNPLTPTNFQAEFFPDGSYEYRYGDHSLSLQPFRNKIQLAMKCASRFRRGL